MHCDLWKRTVQLTEDFNHFQLCCRPLFFALTFCLPFALASPHFFFSPLSLFAPAPPYNHAGSWLSFGVVYIAVIVRVQYGDWAESVYSLTGLFCSKSLKEEERIGVWRSKGYVRVQEHTHT